MPADPLERILELLPIQTESMRLLVEAHRLKETGDLSLAQPAYRRSVVALERQLAATERLNADFPSAALMDVVAIVNPLIDALLIEADLHESQGRREAAGGLREAATGLARKYLGDAGIAERQRQLAGALLTQGRFHEGLIALTEARDLFERQGRTVSVAEASIDLAEYLAWLCDGERALAEAERAHRLVADKLAGGPPTESDVWAALSGAAAHFGKPAEAGLLTADLDEARERASLLKISVQIDQTRARIGRRAGRFEEAERLFDRVYPHIPPVAQPAIRWQIAAMRVQERRFEEALAIVDEVEPVFETGLLRQKLAVLLRTKAEALLGLGRPKEALVEIDRALVVLDEFYDPDALWNLHWVRAQILDRLPDPARALEAILASAAVADELRRAPLGWRLDSTFLKDMLPMFQTGIRLAVESSNAAVCCELIEKVKARALTAALRMPHRGPAPDSPQASPQARRLGEISVALDALDYGSAFTESWTAERRRRRQELLAERAALEQTRIADPRWRALTAPVPLDLSGIQKLLAKRGQAVLDLFYEPERIVAVLLTGDALCVESRALSPKLLKALGRYLANFSTPEPNAALFDPSAALAIGAEDLLPAPLLEVAAKARSLVVIPHGPLHLLPWAALMWRKQRLFEILPVAILPNLACLTALDGGFAQPPRLAILGAPDYSKSGFEPLDGAREELRVAEETYANAAGLVGTPRTGGAALEAAFRELADDPHASGAILHLACHASFESEEPQHSALRLADARLDAAEIAATRLPFDEVILSGCNTGQRALAVQGVELLGDDLLGLPGAFLEAGVRSVLVSIPPASDVAGMRFMTLYHEARSVGTTPLPAIQAVQKTMLADALYPIDTWLGFTLYGAQ